MISQTFDMELVNDIFHHPDIWQDIVPAGVSVFDVPYMPGVVYFLVNHTEGVIAFHPFMDGVKIHPNILPINRGKKAYQAVEESIVFMLKEHRNIYAEISAELKHVIRFAKHLQFKVIDTGDRVLLIRRRMDS